MAEVEQRREVVESNIKTATRWLEAVKSGTYQGHRAFDIADVIGFFTKQIEEARKALKVLDAAEAGEVPLPDWAKPENADNAVNLEKLDKVGVAPKVMEPAGVNPNG